MIATFIEDTTFDKETEITWRSLRSERRIDMVAETAKRLADVGGSGSMGS
jgi:hypothetical protein